MQRDLIARAHATPAGVHVATVEDLILLKLIARRPKDLADLAGLLALPRIDWSYVEPRAHDWEVDDLLRALRSAG